MQYRFEVRERYKVRFQSWCLVIRPVLILAVEYICAIICYIANEIHSLQEQCILLSFKAELNDLYFVKWTGRKEHRT